MSSSHIRNSIFICFHNIIFLCSYLRNLYSIFDKLGIPGPKPVWVFGNIGEFRDKVRIYSGSCKIVCVHTDPQLVNTLIHYNVNIFYKIAKDFYVLSQFFLKDILSNEIALDTRGCREGYEDTISLAKRVSRPRSIFLF